MDSADKVYFTKTGKRNYIIAPYNLFHKRLKIEMLLSPIGNHLKRPTGWPLNLL